jgi:hypothetical protein
MRIVETERLGCYWYDVYSRGQPASRQRIERLIRFLIDQKVDLAVGADRQCHFKVLQARGLLPFQAARMNDEWGEFIELRFSDPARPASPPPAPR